MQGLELSEKFYLDFGKPMIESEFSEYSGRIAVGLVGEGSECFGYDDDISTDHDFDPGFCIWISHSDYESFGFQLERAYARLPKDYIGFRRNSLNPSGGKRRGVFTTDGFYSRFLGSSQAPESLMHWLYIPSHSLACASNGKVFRDDNGEFSGIREKLKKGYPEDVRLKKLAAHTALMAQSGLYNYERCVRRGEAGAAQLAVHEFVRHTISVIYLLNNAYEPFYKWAYRGMRGFVGYSMFEHPLVRLTTLANSPSEVEFKLKTMEEISHTISERFIEQNISDSPSSQLELHAASISKNIKDTNLRNMHIMEGI
ncbi:MAG: DUF4037 domain-containing protein [Firmicutes bacterium]|nr:DUF4037 domain-containing protein [Bacillota bacterium]